MPDVINGGCACGRTSYTLNDTPILEVVCHCVDCQRASGGAFAALLFVAGPRLTIRGEAPKYFATTGKSGRVLERGFCPECGTPLLLRWPNNNKLMLLHAGSLEQPATFSPAIELWCSQAADWHPTFDGVAKSAEGPDRQVLKAAIEAHAQSPKR